jgi:hypothetical protein
MTIERQRLPVRHDSAEACLSAQELVRAVPSQLIILQKRPDGPVRSLGPALMASFASSVRSLMAVTEVARVGAPN